MSLGVIGLEKCWTLRVRDVEAIKPTNVFQLNTKDLRFDLSNAVVKFDV